MEFVVKLIRNKLKLCENLERAVNCIINFGM